MTIGVYDSGIGGLTTLTTLEKRLGGYDFFYLADNANMPYGLKTRFELYKTVKAGVEKLNYKSDVQVIACNTASTVVRPDSAFLLYPRLSGLRPEETLIAATPATLDALSANSRGFNTVETPELATLIEIAASLSFKRRSDADFDILNDYIQRKFKPYDGVSTVVLGCSHYVYARTMVLRCLKNVKVIDGNTEVADDLCSKLPHKEGNSKVKFAFTGANETEKYLWLYSNLKTGILSSLIDV